jgi:hypothetical protein
LECRQIGRIGVVDCESETRHLISESWTGDDVNARGRPGEGSIGAENIRWPLYRIETSSRLTYGANDEAKLEESIVVGGT